MSSTGHFDEVAAPARETAGLFSDLAELYDRFTRILEAPGSPVNRWVQRHLGHGLRALDAGCGAGRYTDELASRYTEVVGVDAAPAMIEIAQRDRPRSNTRFENRDVCTLSPEQDGVFDLVFAFSTVLHVGSPTHVLPRLRELVAPGGKLLLVEPAKPPRWGDSDWQVDLAFHTARAAFDATGDPGQAELALRVILSPTWLQISEISVPLAAEEFRDEYSTALPGLTIEEGDDLIGYFGAVWQAPAP